MAFKKPFHDIKTSAPLRSSDRRKLKQRVVQKFSLEPEAGDVLVPESLLSLKFNTHLDEPGVAYLSPEGDPLWFTLGKTSDDLIPTVYTLWKRPGLLPIVSTPSAVIPILMGGADLMIPGVVQCPPHVGRTDVVAVACHLGGNGAIAPPTAVGRLAVPPSEMRDGAKGKAVHVLHTFGDSLWEMGSKAEPPDTIDVPLVGQSAEPPINEPVGDPPGELESGEDPAAATENTLATSTPVVEITPQEVTALLRTSIIQAIHTQLSKLPPSAFPIPASTLYSTYILPSRRISPHSASTPIDIKHSSHKNLTSFLKSIEKDGLLRLKDFKGDLNILGDQEKRAEKWAEREKADKEKTKRMIVRELWKPHAQSVHFFEEIGKNPKELYSSGDLRTTINDYAVSRAIINPREQQYIHPDALLLSVLAAPKSSETIQYVKRDEAVKRLSDRMQAWHEVVVDGKDPIIRKGPLKPISVVVKLRQGRKASTLITGFETFFIAPEFLSEELKRICATSASISPVPGKGNAMEVLVQGKQIASITELLLAQGIPRMWIETADLADRK